MQAWAVHDYKHDIAITQLVNGLQLRSETVRNRFIDRANYAILGLILHEEMEAERLYNESQGIKAGTITHTAPNKPKYIIETKLGIREGFFVIKH